ncbi:MAG: SRPBCC domain-containing protein [Acidobacteriaceae bacterium]
MASRAEYVPGPAYGARVEKDEERWTLVLVRELRHPPTRVWEALTDPEHLREWAPFDADRKLGSTGATVELTWTGTARVTEAVVTRAEAPKVLEFGDLRWELEPLGKGTRLTLWHAIDQRYMAWGAAGWHISFDVLDRLLAGAPMGRIVGGEGWQRLVREYSRQFGTTTPGESKAAQES